MGFSSNVNIGCSYYVSFVERKEMPLEPKALCKYADLAEDRSKMVV
jgi:hypothetical protein